MIACPYCDNENIEGADVCDQCGQPLSDMHLTSPISLVEKSLLNDRIETLQPRQPVTVSADTPISDVLKKMVANKMGCVLVLEGETLVGIFSERDALLKLNTEAAEHADRPVSDFMTTSPRTLTASSKIAFAVRQMDLGGYRHVPIVDETGTATGIISVRDILRYLSSKITAAEVS